MIFNFRPDLYLDTRKGPIKITVNIPGTSQATGLVYGDRVFFRWNTKGKPIYWGDGTTSVGTNIVNGSDIFNYKAPQYHVYGSQGGTYTITIPADTEFIFCNEYYDSANVMYKRVYYPQPFCSNQTTFASYAQKVSGVTTEFREYLYNYQLYDGDEGIFTTPQEIRIDTPSVSEHLIEQYFHFKPASQQNDYYWNYDLNSITFSNAVNYIVDGSLGSHSGSFTPAGVIHPETVYSKRASTITFEGEPPRVVDSSGSILLNTDVFRHIADANTTFYVPSEYETTYKGTYPYSNYSSQIIGV